MNQSIWLALDRASRNVDAVMNADANRLNLSAIECHILLALSKDDGVHASTLATAVGRLATSFTPNLDSLERKGLLDRRDDPYDRRAVNIHLTYEGKQAAYKARDLIAEIDKLFIDSLTAADVQAFERVMAVLAWETKL